MYHFREKRVMGWTKLKSLKGKIKDTIRYTFCNKSETGK